MEKLDAYGWNSPGRTSLLGECHQIACTLELLTHSFFIEIAWDFFRLVKNCHWTDNIKKNYKHCVKKKIEKSPTLWEFWTFLKIQKIGNFVTQISPWRQHLQKKWSIPPRSQRKMQQNCQFRILIFETLSQRFFYWKFVIFQKFKKLKNLKNGLL